MRQVGVLAAAGLIALEDGPKRLHEDHENARTLADGLAEIDGISIDSASVQTNIVIFEVSGAGFTAAEVCARLKHAGVLAIGISQYQVRMVTHLNVSRSQITEVLATLRSVLSRSQD